MAAVVLSMVVRSGPVRTAVNGTLVARPPMTTPVPVAPLAPSFAAGWGPLSVTTTSWESRERGAIVSCDPVWSWPLSGASVPRDRGRIGRRGDARRCQLGNILLKDAEHSQNLARTLDPAHDGSA
jgi:hypothetical protein